MQTENRHISKSSSYGTYIDFPFITTNSLVEGKNVIVGELAEYIETLESICTKYEDGLQKLAVQEIIKDDKERLHTYDTVFSRIYTKLLLPTNPILAEQEIYATNRNLEMANYMLEQKDQKIAELEKALELACKYIAYAEIAGNPEIVNEYTSIDSYKKYEIEHFKSKAKKELNNDR